MSALRSFGTRCTQEEETTKGKAAAKAHAKQQARASAKQSAATNRRTTSHGPANIADVAVSEPGASSATSQHHPSHVNNPSGRPSTSVTESIILPAGTDPATSAATSAATAAAKGITAHAEDCLPAGNSPAARAQPPRWMVCRLTKVYPCVSCIEALLGYAEGATSVSDLIEMQTLSTPSIFKTRTIRCDYDAKSQSMQFQAEYRDHIVIRLETRSFKMH